jgi:hypothetical protein
LRGDDGSHGWFLAPVYAKIKKAPPPLSGMTNSTVGVPLRRI